MLQKEMLRKYYGQLWDKNQRRAYPGRFQRKKFLTASLFSSWVEEDITQRYLMGTPIATWFCLLDCENSSFERSFPFLQPGICIPANAHSHFMKGFYPSLPLTAHSSLRRAFPVCSLQLPRSSRKFFHHLVKVSGGEQGMPVTDF